MTQKTKSKANLKILDHPDRRANTTTRTFNFEDGELRIKYWEGRLTGATALWFLEQAKKRILE